MDLIDRRLESLRYGRLESLRYFFPPPGGAFSRRNRDKPMFTGFFAFLTVTDLAFVTVSDPHFRQCS